MFTLNYLFKVTHYQCTLITYPHHSLKPCNHYLHPTSTYINFSAFLINSVLAIYTFCISTFITSPPCILSSCKYPSTQHNFSYLSPKCLYKNILTQLLLSFCTHNPQVAYSLPIHFKSLSSWSTRLHTTCSLHIPSSLSITPLSPPPQT